MMSCREKFAGMIACPILDAIVTDERQIGIVEARCNEQTWNAMVSLERDEEDAEELNEHAASRRKTIDHLRAKSTATRFRIQTEDLEKFCNAPEDGPSIEEAEGYIAVTCQSAAIGERTRRLLMRMIITEETLAD
jgi:hypothetical protein